VKRLCADDSAATSVKVGYRQASYMQSPPSIELGGLFALAKRSPREGLASPIPTRGLFAFP
jgi:hypothetical protein